jgi:hypothetical protein
LAKQNDLQTGRSVPDSGIYRVLHPQHTLPQEVTLLKDQFFPRCSRCSNAIYFELVRPALAIPNARGFSVTLYELPVLGEQNDESLAV